MPITDPRNYAFAGLRAASATHHPHTRHHGPVLRSLAPARRGLVLALLGVAIGGGVSLLLGRIVSQLLYGMEAVSPLTTAAVSLVLMLTAGAACLLPARRAMSVDPIVALRHE